MSSRDAVRAGSFYPAGRSACLDALSACLASAGPASDAGDVLGGIVPHAGWVYSGPTAAKTLAAVGEPAPRAFLFFGAVHVPGVRKASTSPHTAWTTPLGDVAVDEELKALLEERAGSLLHESEKAHRGEHSIEVQVPLVRRLYPAAKILPVAVPPDPAAVELGRIAGRLFRELPDRVVVVGSTDLTHYGPDFYGFAPAGVGPEAHRWAKEENDRSFLERVTALDAEGALADALEKRNACGAGAAAAAVAAAGEMGARSAELLQHVTSHEVRADDPSPTNFVGYASVIFRKAAPPGTATG